MTEINHCFIDTLKMLKDSASESVENITHFSDFKQYMHIERDIERELLSLLEAIQRSNESHLVLLCGSVGDGKSHLLSKIKSSHPELLSSFAIHNDASESFKTDGTSIETLNEVLDAFSDEKLASSNQKMILAINLGVLSNFMNSSFAKENYTKLQTYIQASGVFHINKKTKRSSHLEQFHLVSFGDYQLFELTEQGPSSTYLREILNKITSNTEENVFYQSYKDNCLNGCPFSDKCPVKVNYEAMMESKVKESISTLLIEAIVKEKLIIPTRALLNFIYEMMVGPFFDKTSKTELTKHFQSEKYLNEYVSSLYMMLLFEHKDRSYILSGIQNIDPIHFRNEQMDQLLTTLYTSQNPLQILEEYVVMNENVLLQLKDALTNKKTDVQELFKFMVRSQRFGSVIKSLSIDDERYLSFMKYLYHFHYGSNSELYPLYSDIEQAIRNWYGSMDKEFIYLSDQTDPFVIGHRLELNYEVSHITKSAETSNYFTPNLELRFKKKYTEGSEPAGLDVDYALFSLLIKVKEGYRPNKKDKSNYLQFSEFYERIMDFGGKSKQIKIINKYKDTFRLEYDEGFQTFRFERIES